MNSETYLLSQNKCACTGVWFENNLQVTYCDEHREDAIQLRAKLARQKELRQELAQLDFSIGKLTQKMSKFDGDYDNLPCVPEYRGMDQELGIPNPTSWFANIENADPAKRTKKTKTEKKTRTEKKTK